MTADLPAGLAEPLHILEPWPYRDAALALVALALVALWWVYRRWRRRARRPSLSPGAVAPAPASAGGIAEAIQRLLHRYHHTAHRRQGCHELAALVRDHLESRLGRRGGRPPLATLTAREIAGLAGAGSPVATLLDLLAELQFGRRPPSRGDFEGICHLALAVVGAAGGHGDEEAVPGQAGHGGAQRGGAK